jgi:hypothetical protein
MLLSEPGKSMDTHGLTEPQRRHVAVFLQQVEEALDEIESLASSPASEAKLFRIDIDDLPAGFHEAIRPAVHRIRVKLKHLVDKLGLESNPRSRSRHIQALVVTTIVQIEDTGSRGLRGYGLLGPVVFDTIDPALAEIHSALEQIAAGVTRRGAS